MSAARPLFTSRDARRLTVDDLRRLSNWLDHQNGAFWDGRDVQTCLDLCWAAEDAGYVSFSGWYNYDHAAAQAALDVADDAQAQRHKEDA